MKISTDPLLAETVPDGTFGGPRTRPRDTPPPWTPTQQARHLAELAAGLTGWHDSSPRAVRDRERHRPTRPTTERSTA